MEFKEVLDALDKIEGKMSETAASNKERLDELGEQQRKFANQLLDLQQKGVKVQGEKTEAKSGGRSVHCRRRLQGVCRRLHAENSRRAFGDLCQI